MQARGASKHGSGGSKPGSGGGSKSSSSSSKGGSGSGEATFSTNLLKCSDAQFCSQLNATQAEYDSFRQQLFGGAVQPRSSVDADSDDEL